MSLVHHFLKEIPREKKSQLNYLELGYFALESKGNNFEQVSGFKIQISVDDHNKVIESYKKCPRVIRVGSTIGDFDVFVMAYGAKKKPLESIIHGHCFGDEGIQIRNRMVLLLGLVVLSVGIVFAVEASSVKDEVTVELQAEQITLGIDEVMATNGEVVDSALAAKLAFETIREHRHDNWGTYNDTARGSPERDQYIQALALENSLNLARAGFGVADLALYSGIAMIIMGIAISGTGVALIGLTRAKS